MRSRRRPRTPEVLRRAYGGSVNTLDAVILSLLPTPPPDSPLDCSCNGRLCLGCVGQYYLVGDEAPSDFVRILTHSFCFVSPRAPPPPANFSTPDLGLRHESGFFAVRTINCSHFWDHLLERIGDEFMAFLLRYSSIFVPFANQNYLQVTGELLKDPKFISLRVQKGGDFHCSQLVEVSADNAEQSLRIQDSRALKSPCNDVTENSLSSFSSQSRKRKREFSWTRRKKRKKIGDTPKSMTASDLHVEYCVTDHSPINISKSNLMKDKFSVDEEISQEHRKIISHCLDCIVLHCPSKAEMETDIKRNFMFYVRLSSHSLFPKDHILNRLKPTNSGAISLLGHIFGVSTNDNGSELCCSSLNSTMSKTACSCFMASKFKCLFHSLICLLKCLIRNCRRCQHKKLLRRHCLNPDFNKNRTIHDGSEMEHELIDSYSTHQQVVSFVWAATRSLIPEDLLGDYMTWRALRKNISKFVKLRRFERFSLKQCMHQLKVCHYPFLSKTTFLNCTCNGFGRNDENYRMRRKHFGKSCDDNCSLQNKLFRNWIYWYFSHVVVPLLGNNFYVTERETGKQDIFYYPRPIWKKLFRSTVSHLKDLNYSILDRTSLEKILCERRNNFGGSTFGFSRIRFVPKEKNVRPLANLKAPSKFVFSSRKNVGAHVKAVKVQSKFIWYKSVNYVLHELYVVLKSIKAEDPSKLGSSVFDYNEVYQRLYPFVTRVRNGSEDFHKLFIVVADVAKAYDSIDQDMLIGIMNDVIPPDTYFFRNYSRFVCTKNSIKVMPYRLGSFHCSKNHDIMKIEASIQLNSSRHVFIDKGTGVEVSNHMLHRVLSEHLKHNILQIGPDYYLQEVGITQGSVLSSLLCSFYYGYLERNVIFPFLEKAYEISSRTDKRELEFLDADDHENKLPKNASGSENSTEVRVSHKPITTNSNSDRNCAVEVQRPLKPQNLLLRFVDDFLFISTSEQQASSFFTRMRRGFKAFNSYMNFKKFGFNFNIEGNPVSERFYTGADGKKFIPWCGLLINSENLEIQADYTRYWGSHVSSTITIQPNTGSGCTLRKKLCDYVRPKCYPLFYDSNINSLPTVTLNAYQAFLLCAMKFHCYARSMPSFNKLNPSYILDIFLFSFRYMYKLLKKRMHQAEIRHNVKPILKLRKTEILWLGLCAYARVLKKKQSRYKELISLVRVKIAELDVEYSLPYLRYAVDDSHSSLFWEIVF